MSGAELVRIARRLYGGHGWQKRLSADLGVDVSTLRRWRDAEAIPGPAALAVELMDIMDGELTEVDNFRK
jgi:hypothetical protein